MIIPDTLTQTILDAYGEAGAEWLRRLPELVAELEERRCMVVQDPYAPLSWNYVAPAVCAGGDELVLKAGFPNPELTTEIEALRFYDGRGAVRLLEGDPERGVLLLERLQPGKPLAGLAGDEEATAVAAEVMRRLWRPAPAAHGFPTVAQWAEGLRRLRERFGGGTGPLPGDLVARAEGLFAELLGSEGEPVLLHGDLHHWNIVSAEREPWLAIDPKGVVGEREFEVGPWLLNRLPPTVEEARPLLARRIDQFAEMLGFDRQRLLGWGLARAVLAAWWDIEDEQGDAWRDPIACAEALAGL